MLERQQENIKQLLKLIKENPELEILPMIDSECVPCDDYAYWAGRWGSAEIDEYYCSDERVYFKSQDCEEMIDDWIDKNYDKYPRSSDELLVERAAAAIEICGWVKAIVVKIDNL